NLPPIKVMLGGALPMAAKPAGNVIHGLPVRQVSAIGSSAILGTMIISYLLNNGKAYCITI
ncbi:hypothetical protein ACKI18_48015, partial [Streptomyces niveiscabiei]